MGRSHQKMLFRVCLVLSLFLCLGWNAPSGLTRNRRSSRHERQACYVIRCYRKDRTKTTDSDSKKKIREVIKASKAVTQAFQSHAKRLQAKVDSDIVYNL